MKIYISGKITGLPQEVALDKFNRAEEFLSRQHPQNEPVNPMKLVPYDENLTWEDYMLGDIKALFKCHAIFLMPCYSDSKGARIEFAIAQELGLKIILDPR